ncbi:MAG: hypothetical protein J6P73_07430, partial [Bacteroidales bacterium]|nr:hypothetical protein [Bacteroidales bacterium]
EMRFAAAQIPAKIGGHSLNGENLQHSLRSVLLQTVRRSSRSFAPISSRLHLQGGGSPKHHRILTSYLLPYTLHLSSKENYLYLLA